MSDGRDEDESYGPVCPGCGIYMQDSNPDLPGFYKQTKLTISELSDVEELDEDDEEDEMVDEIEASYEESDEDESELEMGDDDDESLTGIQMT